MQSQCDRLLESVEDRLPAFRGHPHLFTEMGATGHAERVARELAELR